MSERLVIDGAVLEAEIAALRSLRAGSPTQTPVSLSSVGRAARVTGLLPGDFQDFEVALDALIDATVAFLINVRDTFVDVDQAAADAAARLDEELG